MSWLLDTRVLWDAARGTDAGLLRWLEAQPERDLHLSVLSLGELRKGIARLPEGARRTQLDAWVSRDLPARFDGRLLPVDADVAAAWGDLAARAAQSGRSLPVTDGLLLATAHAHQLTLVTHNVADVRDRGVPILDPWSGTATT